MRLVIVGENTRKNNKQLHVQECLNMIYIALDTNIIISKEDNEPDDISLWLCKHSESPDKLLAVTTCNWLAADFSADCCWRSILVITEDRVAYILRLSLLVIGDEGDNCRFERSKEWLPCSSVVSSYGLFSKLCVVSILYYAN